MADAGFPAYKLTPAEVEVAKSFAEVRAVDTLVGAGAGLVVGGLLGFVGLRKRRLPWKLLTTGLSTTFSSMLFFTYSTHATMSEWGLLDNPGHFGEGQISFMAEFARRMVLDQPETLYTNKQLHVFYRQQLRGEVMRILTAEEEREEREAAGNVEKSKKSGWWW